MKKTKNLGLNLPEMGDVINIDDINENSKKLDELIPQVGAAPAGFGLGGQGQDLDDTSDLDTLFNKNGWYQWVKSVPANAPTLQDVGSGNYRFYTHMLVIDEYQIICSLNSPNCFMIRSNIHKIWEWVNPPMEPGMEYRTTERYYGKPVYCKLFEIISEEDFGKPGTVLSWSFITGFGSAYRLISVDAKLYEGRNVESPLPYMNGNGYITLVSTMQPGRIYVTSNGPVFKAGTKWSFKVKYIKEE